MSNSNSHLRSHVENRCISDMQATWLFVFYQVTFLLGQLGWATSSAMFTTEEILESVLAERHEWSQAGQEAYCTSVNFIL